MSTTIDPKALSNAETWLNGNFDDATKEKIKTMKLRDIDEFNESFYRSLEFGTGGLRGIMGVGTNRMNIYTVAMTTQGFANYIRLQFPSLTHPKIAISFDSRNNSETFAKIAAKVMSANGIQTYLFDNIRPTPELSFAIRHLKCQAGIMLTASHNPKEYNGYKAYWEDGGQLVPPHDTAVIKEVDKIIDFSQVATDEHPELITIIGQEIDRIYLDKIKEQSLSPEVIKKQHNLKIIYTPLHGTGYKLVPQILKELGFSNVESVAEQSIPDGNFPFCKSPNPEEYAAMEMGLRIAKETDAALLLATDPDADRVGVAAKDLSGEFVLLNGNQTLAIILFYVLKKWEEKKKLSNKHFSVKTIVTSELTTAIATKFGVEIFDVLTGFKWIAKKILDLEPERRFVAGGEESVGYLIGDFVRDKDAVGACAMIAEIAAWAAEQNKGLYDILTDIYQEFGYYYESLISIVRKGRSGAEEIASMMKNYRSNPPSEINNSPVVLIKDYLVKEEYNLVAKTTTPIDLPTSNVLQFYTQDGSKITVRPSGTEPKIKYYFSIILELKDKSKEKEIRQQAQTILAKIADSLDIRP